MLRSTKPPRCKFCKERTEKVGMALHLHCVDSWLKREMEKKARRMERKLAEARRNEKRRDRERKRAIRKLSEFKADAQRAFNAWVRRRDEGLPCVSCGETNPPMLPGGQWDAGHFLSRGAYPELAFEPLNVWKQCKSCNAGSGKFAHKARTVAERYEEELLRRIGPEKLAWLKGPHAPKKYTRDDYEQIEETYKAKCKELEREK